MKTDAMHDPYHEDCVETLHCYIHGIDEPNGYFACLECFHAFPTPADLLADTNALLAEMGLPPETDPEKIWTCPHCAHDF